MEELMTHVLAALDDTSAAPVLETAAYIAQSLGAVVRAVQGEPWSDEAQEQAAALGIPLELLAGPAQSAVLDAADDPDLALIVVGLRITADQIPGKLVHALADQLRVPLVLVPEHAVPVVAGDALGQIRQPIAHVLTELAGATGEVLAQLATALRRHEQGHAHSHEDAHAERRETHHRAPRAVGRADVPGQHVPLPTPADRVPDRIRSELVVEVR